ncbi:SDR family NAD(P)-dependent oxidoreductase [Mycolicibacterium sediminis]|uniref:Short-chain dehydrogenase n=1 Tax=Mycolicibacterium sediminis TaxID=1286180 RepID=A0A7I7R000_9MYCO|nr:SDR family oxidoreductase [Mycolicibacterium sediminis]BBY31928.1 hypothetical protein MSEDJ_60240 [Mycolicibacterium sediminis]
MECNPSAPRSNDRHIEKGPRHDHLHSRVAIVTGASQGIGEALVAGYRRLGYSVVANSRSIGEHDDPGVLAVAGDIGQPGSAPASWPPPSNASGESTPW